MSLLRHSWQQGLRIVWRLATLPGRREPVQAILVITSDGAKGSHQDFEGFHALLTDRLTDAVDRGALTGPVPAIVHLTQGGIDFEEYSDMFDTLNRAVDHARDIYGAGHDEVCIDITAGLKVFSIAAANVTMNRKLIFSYINNEGEPQYYDATIELGALLGKD